MHSFGRGTIFALAYEIAASSGPLVWGGAFHRNHGVVAAGKVAPSVMAATVLPLLRLALAKPATAALRRADTCPAGCTMTSSLVAPRQRRVREAPVSVERTDSVPERKTDLELVRRALVGRPGAFEEIVDSYHRMVYRVAWGVCRNDADADDVVQAAFIKLHDDLPRYDARKASLGTWLYRITLNAARDFLRREKRHRGHESLDAGRSHDPACTEREHSAEASELEELVREAMAALSEQQRRIVVLHQVEGLKSVEIAEVIGSTPQSVRVQLCHARKKLSARMSSHIPGV